VSIGGDHAVRDLDVAGRAAEHELRGRIEAQRFLGAQHPATDPFTYRRLAVLLGAETEEPPLLTSSARNLSANRGEPVSVFVWRFPDDRPATVAPPLDEAARQRLRALGYVA